MRRRFLVIVVVMAICGVSFSLWQGPKWQAASLKDVYESEALLKLENQTRKTWAQILGGMFFLITLYFAWKRIEVSREDQITERFTQAVEQLESEKLEVRLGGIYALEWIAGDSAKDHWTIMEILAAYVRENAPSLLRETSERTGRKTDQAEEDGEDEKQEEETGKPTEEKTDRSSKTDIQKVPIDIQAILTVLGRRARRKEEKEDQYLNLSSTDLRGVDLRGAHLEKADLKKAHLERADLREARLERADLRGAYLKHVNLMKAHLERTNLFIAHLEEADLRGTHLEGAILREAYLEKANLFIAHLEGTDLKGTHLEGAILWGAHLEGAILREAHLEGADLRGAHLERADLRGTDLLSAKSLRQEQIDQAFTEEPMLSTPQQDLVLTKTL